MQLWLQWFCPQMKGNDEVNDQLTSLIPANRPVYSHLDCCLCLSMKLQDKKKKNSIMASVPGYSVIPSSITSFQELEVGTKQNPLLLDGFSSQVK